MQGHAKIRNGLHVCTAWGFLTICKAQQLCSCSCRPSRTGMSGAPVPRVNTMEFTHRKHALACWVCCVCAMVCLCMCAYAIYLDAVAAVRSSFQTTSFQSVGWDPKLLVRGCAETQGSVVHNRIPSRHEHLPNATTCVMPTTDGSHPKHSHPQPPKTQPPKTQPPQTQPPKTQPPKTQRTCPHQTQI